MCGIGGIMYADSTRPVNPQILMSMAAIQYHRGPGSCGYEVVDGRWVGFTHARLSIIDLTPKRGRQPFCSVAGAR